MAGVPDDSWHTRETLTSARQANVHLWLARLQCPHVNKTDGKHTAADSYLLLAEYARQSTPECS